MDNSRQPGPEPLRQVTPKRRFSLICVCHFAVDAYASFFSQIAAVVRMAPEALGLAGTLFQCSLSFSQLAFGFLADRGRPYRHIVFGIFAAGTFLSLAAAITHQTWLFTTLLVLGGLGIASFHPAGVVMAAESSPHGRAVGVSLFVMVGTIGFALAPVGLVRFIEAFGLQNVPFLAVPAVLLAAAVFLPFRRDTLAHMSTAAREADVHSDTRSDEKLSALRTPWIEHRATIFCLYVLVVVRSALQVSIGMFLPRLLVEWNYTDGQAAWGFALFSAGGAVGMFTGGILTARVDRQALQLVSSLVGIPAALTFLLLTPPLPLLYALIAIAGFFILLTNSMHIIMGQELAPQSARTVSSLMMGVGWGVGGLGPTIVGNLAPQLGIAGALSVVVGAALLTLPMTLLLPKRPVASDHAAAVETS